VDLFEVGSAAGSVQSSTRESRKPAKPVALQRVLFGSGDLDQEEVPLKDLEAAFREIDVDASGVIDAGELVNALKLCGLDASLTATEIILKEIDKNVSGTIDLHEFIEFFRSLEEMGRFSQRKEQRAKFVNFMLNFCFLITIVSVCVLLLIFINMDEEEDAETYQLMQNILYGFIALLAILFLAIIIVPVVRFTFGVTASGMAKKLLDQHKARKYKPPPSMDNPADAGGPGAARHTAATLPGMPQPLPADIALTTISYRQGRGRTAPGSAQAPSSGTSPPPGNPALLQPPTVSIIDRSQGIDASQGITGSHSIAASQGITASQGVASSSPSSGSPSGGFRYDPNAYRNAQYAMDMGLMKTSSFNPMQVRDVHINYVQQQQQLEQQQQMLMPELPPPAPALLDDDQMSHSQYSQHSRHVAIADDDDN